MKQVFRCLGVVGILVGATLVGPRPAHAISLLPICLFTSPAAGTTIYQISEIGSAVNPTPFEDRTCVIENTTFGAAPIKVDVFHPDAVARNDPLPVSDQVDLTPLFNSPTANLCTGGPTASCTVVTLNSDPGEPTGVETGLPSRANDPDVVSGATVYIPLNEVLGRGVLPGSGRFPCTDNTTSTGSCLDIESDAEVPELPTGLLLGSVLPGLFGITRFSRRGA